MWEGGKMQLFTSVLFSYLPHLSLSFQAIVSWDSDRPNSDHAR